MIIWRLTGACGIQTLLLWEPWAGASWSRNIDSGHSNLPITQSSQPKWPPAARSQHTSYLTTVFTQFDKCHKLLFHLTHSYGWDVTKRSLILWYKFMNFAQWDWSLSVSQDPRVILIDSGPQVFRGRSNKISNSSIVSLFALVSAELFIYYPSQGSEKREDIPVFVFPSFSVCLIYNKW